MNGALLQAKLYAGYAKAAQRVGQACQQYRPLTATSQAIAPGNLLQSLLASFNPQDMTYGKAQVHGKAAWFCLADGTQLAPSDYLVRPDGRAFFIAAMQPLLPILAIECNRVVSVFRPHQQTAVGAVGYGGETTASQTPLVTQFPASVLQGSKGEKSLVNLPGDVRSPWWVVLLPNLPGATYLRTDDVMTDELGRRYKLSSCEQTELGWRISATEAET